MTKENSEVGKVVPMLWTLFSHESNHYNALSILYRRPLLCQDFSNLDENDTVIPERLNQFPG